MAKASIIAARQAQALQEIAERQARIEARLGERVSAVPDAPSIVIHAANPEEALAAAELFRQRLGELLPVQFRVEIAEPQPSVQPDDPVAGGDQYPLRGQDQVGDQAVQSRAESDAPETADSQEAAPSAESEQSGGRRGKSK
jgi:hypothetical protein